MKCSELPMTVLLWILGSAHVHMPECGDAANILHIGGWRIGQGDGERESLPLSLFCCCLYISWYFHCVWCLGFSDSISETVMIFFDQC